METTTSVQRPEKAMVSSSRPLISRVLLPGSAESSTSMLYKHRETGEISNSSGCLNVLYGKGTKGFMHMPGKPHRAVRAIATQIACYALNIADFCIAHFMWLRLWRPDRVVQST